MEQRTEHERPEDGYKSKTKENPNMNKMGHQPSYADVTKMEAELRLKLACLITEIVDARK